MRQAGRYLPEYREVRAKAGGFLDLCFKPELAAEVTLQPIRRFGFDAAIIFSDILVIPYALGRSVRFEVGEGPRLDPLDTPDKSRRWPRTPTSASSNRCSKRSGSCARALDPKTALIGFCGAPWTVATYMVAGQGTPDQAPARMMAYRHPEAFAKIIDVLVENSIEYLLAQLEGRRRCVADLRHLGRRAAAARVRALVDRADPAHRRRRARQVPDAKIIGFPRGAGAQLPAYVEATGVNAVSIDWTAEPAFIRERVQSRVAVQGNLDPLVLITGGAALDRAVDDVLANFAQGPASSSISATASSRRRRSPMSSRCSSAFGASSLTPNRGESKNRKTTPCTVDKSLKKLAANRTRLTRRTKRITPA